MPKKWVAPLVLEGFLKVDSLPGLSWILWGLSIGKGLLPSLLWPPGNHGKPGFLTEEKSKIVFSESRAPRSQTMKFNSM